MTRADRPSLPGTGAQQFAGRVAVVTGAGHGIGRATAMELARRGATAVIADVDEVAGERVADEIRAEGGRAQAICTDMAIPEQIARLLDTAYTSFGQLDILVNNAAVTEANLHHEPNPSYAEHLTEATWDFVFAVNVKAVWLASKLATPYLRASGGGSIINAGSVAGIVGYPGGAAYSASKAAVVNLTRAMAAELADDLIRVNCYCPGAIETGFLPFFRGDTDEDRQRRSATVAPILMRRAGKPEEVAMVICFLASDEASFITGAAVTVDGGTLAWRGVRELSY